MTDEHKVWLSSLDFYKEDLNIIKNRLTEIAGKYSNKDIAAHIEHFENQLKIQFENIDILTHGINENLSDIAHELAENTAGYISVDLVIKHDSKKELFQNTEKVINTLRQEFITFAAKWM